MKYTTHYIDTLSDQHGEPCEWCQLIDHTCITNIYTYNDFTGDGELLHTCIDDYCINHALDYHNSDYDPLIEISTVALDDAYNALETV